MEGTKDNEMPFVQAFSKRNDISLVIFEMFQHVWQVSTNAITNYNIIGVRVQ